MPQKPHTIPSTPHRGSGVLPAMVSVAAVCDRRRPQGRDAAPSGSHSRGSAAGSAVVPDGPLPCSTGVVRLWSAKPTPSGPPVIVPTGGRCSVSAQASGAASAVLSHAGRRDASPTPSRRSAASPLDARLSSLDSSPSSATRHSRFPALTFPTLSTILHPHEHGQNPLDPRSSSDRAAQGSRHCGVSGVGRQGMPDSGLGIQASFISKSCYEQNLQRLLVIAERIQGQNHPVDVYSLDRTVHLRFRRHQVSLIPVAAVCDRRPAGSAVVPDGPHPCSTGFPPIIVPTGGRCSVSAQALGAGSAVLSQAGRQDASPTPSRRSAASLLDARLSSLDSSPPSVTRHSRSAASSAPPHLRVNPSAILDRMTRIYRGFQTDPERSGERQTKFARRVSKANQLTKLTESERSGERLPQAAQRVSLVNQFRTQNCIQHAKLKLNS